MSQLLDTMSAMLEAEVALDQWDCPPSIGVVLREDDEIVIEPFTFTPAFWELGPIAEILWTMSKAIQAIGLPRNIIQRLDGNELVGVVLYNEGWAVRVEADDPNLEAIQRAAGQHKLHENPNRVEVKLMSAVDVNARRYGVQFARGVAEAMACDEDDGDDSGLSGAVYDHMHLIMTSVIQAKARFDQP